MPYMCMASDRTLAQRNIGDIILVNSPTHIDPIPITSRLSALYPADQFRRVSSRGKYIPGEITPIASSYPTTDAKLRRLAQFARIGATTGVSTVLELNDPFHTYTPFVHDAIARENIADRSRAVHPKVANLTLYTPIQKLPQHLHKKSAMDVFKTLVQYGMLFEGTPVDQPTDNPNHLPPLDVLTKTDLDSVFHNISNTHPDADPEPLSSVKSFLEKSWKLDDPDNSGVYINPRNGDSVGVNVDNFSSRKIQRAINRNLQDVSTQTDFNSDSSPPNIFIARNIFMCPNCSHCNPPTPPNDTNTYPGSWRSSGTHPTPLDDPNHIFLNNFKPCTNCMDDISAVLEQHPLMDAHSQAPVPQQPSMGASLNLGGGSSAGSACPPNEVVDVAAIPSMQEYFQQQGLPPLPSLPTVPNTPHLAAPGFVHTREPTHHRSSSSVSSGSGIPPPPDVPPPSAGSGVQDPPVAASPRSFGDTHSSHHGSTGVAVRQGALPGRMMQQHLTK
eukprot:TRINITY_DN12021_c0_g1_i1.p1 TRINITY_DN12021_c0_g1~~TRINITY_DN12021_c0_g1_i1.p1  ORF type:complete len:515 (-),score=52.53 TRINITY_DN12021_c0_g1_i1:237-1739(-)